MELRDLPGVDQVLGRLAPLLARFPRELVVGEVRRVLDEMRAGLRSGASPDEASVEERVERSLAALARPSLRRVINATGVILHTNLGRAPLPGYPLVTGYSNLEYDLEAGARGRRDVHAGGLLRRLLGAPAIAVNNNAAAVYLVLHELAAGQEVLVSRGELIEIGDGFRIPEIMAHSGALVREVGTTNRTHLDDYREALTPRTRLILRVHRSNFRMSGFTSSPGVAELAALGRETGVPVYEDLGSGCLMDLSAWGIDEPQPAASLRAGAGLVSFSGDKLLGGPQAGIIAGQPDLVSRLRRNPMYRAFRLDKLVLQALETTARLLVLGEHRRIPVLRMITMPADEIRARAELVLARLDAPGVELTAGESVVGGGSTPGQSLPTWLMAFASAAPDALERQLRSSDPPVLARIERNRLLIDLRTVQPEEEAELTRALQALSW
ncbi:MAG: L-seryl-tRNA(Sec) selenium transferase [Bryobacterales bacterium]|nr:L-seryl-tRNA(Sec) selenium transferase [Bryobacterales bacterium]